MPSRSARMPLMFHARERKVRVRRNGPVCRLVISGMCFSRLLDECNGKKILVLLPAPAQGSHATSGLQQPRRVPGEVGEDNGRAGAADGG